MDSVLDFLKLSANGGSVLNTQPPEPVRLRRTDDVAATRDEIYRKVLAAVGNIGKLQNSRHTLELIDPQYIDGDHFSLADQKKALLTGRTLSRRIGGTWRLSDAVTGKPIDERKMTIAALPYYTPRGTYILNGSEWALSNQSRLRPGIFVRQKSNAELEAHINPKTGFGISHRYFLDPVSNIFKINIGQAKLPLMPVLKAYGVTDKEIRDSWGGEIASANQQADNPQVLDKLYDKIVGKKVEGESKSKAVIAKLSSMVLDPEVTRRTIGRPHATLTKDAILDTTKKLISVSRGESDVNDRDSMSFQDLYSAPDLLAERVTRDRKFLNQLLWKASFRGDLSGLVPGALTKQFHHTILNTGLGFPLEEISPIELLDAQTRTTRLGSGGIEDMSSIPDESRNVHPSQYGVIDLVRSPESERTGVDVRLTRSAMIGSDNKIYSPFRDVRTNKQVYKTPQDTADLNVAFPNQMNSGNNMVAAIAGGKARYIPRDQVHLEAPHFENAFNHLANLIPLKSGIKGQRMAMGSRYLAQALPLTNREAPLVQTGIPADIETPTLSDFTKLSADLFSTPAPTPGIVDRSFEEAYGPHFGAIKATHPGTVKKITPNELHVTHDDGTNKIYDLYHDFVYARKTGITNTPQVQLGQRVLPNQLLASSNFTDDKGVAAPGLNARVVYTPYKGSAYEDAFVISDSFAKRMESQHYYQHEQEWNDKIRRGLRPYISLFPNGYTKEQLKNMDDDGVIKPGSTVKYGEPLMLVAQERERTQSQVHRGRTPNYADNTLTWEHHAPGIVTDVEHTKNGSVVVVKSLAQMQEADKLSGLRGNKGTVGLIVPDHQMPHDKDGMPYEISVNPLGIMTRTNPSLIAETILSKIAKKTGKPYKIEDFNQIQDLAQFTQNEMKKHGVEDMEEITDPTTGRKFNALTGYQYFLKLHHTAESKNQGRSIGGYTQEETPARGGQEGAKRLSLLEHSALLSSGALGFIKDSHLIRGQKNDNYWQAFMSGFRPPDPEVPLVYRKFVDTLKGAGINVVRKNGQVNLMALTNDDIDTLAGDREIQNPDTVSWKEGLTPRRGGLFDQSLTGGHGGNRWSYIKLYEPMPNPTFEEPIRRLLNLTKNKFEDVIAGTETIATGTGPKAIQQALANIDIPKAIQEAEAEAAGSRKGARDTAERKLVYLKSAQKLKIHPSEWMLSKVPVIPPAFRPVSVMSQTGTTLISDPNYLYKEVFDANQNLKELSPLSHDLSQERRDLYNAFKGVTGMGDPIQVKNKEKGVKGLLKNIFGNAPKFSFLQQKLIGTTVDVVGNSVVTPNPDMDMDHIGIPEQKAWEVYKPFIMRNLVRGGVPRLEAARAIKDQMPIARKALQEAVDDRPIVMRRAPVLHRYGIMAFWPKLVKGDTMQVSPLVTKGFGMDFDGDTAAWHVPVSDDAKHDAMNKLLPSKNLFSASTFKPHFTPQMEYVSGLYSASNNREPNKRAHIFATTEDAIRAYREGRVNIETPIEIVKH